mmetsp:Transcript_5351/g.10044  ORF Transcript_5351/g.10044 Transcript_5351/m.10044 type:complete len:425 (+) Transcript_5351:46-1320(+)
MAALCKSDSIEDWERVKCLAAVAHHHKMRIASRHRERNANVPHKSRKAAILDENTKTRKPHNLGQGSKGTSLFAQCVDDNWYEPDDDWHDDWYERYAYYDGNDGSGDGISQPVLRNAWTMFAEMFGGTIVLAQQGIANRTCAICCESSSVLVAELGCKHVACERCWHWWVTQLPQGCLNVRGRWNQKQGTIPCFMPGCPGELGVPARVRASLETGKHKKNGRVCVRASLAAGKHKEAGSVCALCCETDMPLLQNSGCACTACVACWRRWVSTRLWECRMARKLDGVPCFTPGCCEAICLTLLRHTFATSARGSDLIRDFAVRRRLQTNPLYPAESQVDCPRSGCLGLGYLGFDQVMCFVCEHQWVSNGCGPSETMPSEVKECPQCGVQIVKNGGCDHMTCSQCNHEFWWTTLAPYHEHSDGQLW